jgi:hypothetical protein
MNCIICYDDILECDIVSLECGHIFHTNCIINLVRKRNRKCPLCRKRITWNINQLLKHIKLFKGNKN